MRVLGYPNTISLESFRVPNFSLVADILYWLAKSYDSNLDVMYHITTEEGRIIFIKTIVTFMSSKAHIKLNPKKLYGADGYAVKELLKITNLLYEAAITPLGSAQSISIPPPTNLANKVAQIKFCRSLASDLVEKGAQLYEHLGKELELRKIRNEVVSKPFELKAMEEAVSGAINQLQNQMSSMKTTIDNLASDETNLMTKIDKKRNELDRASKRLHNLQGVRPAYMDEYEKVEVELVKLYEAYMEKYRNLSYLEQQLDEFNREEQDLAEENQTNLKLMQERIREEELRLLRGDNDVTTDNHINLQSDRPQRPFGPGRTGTGTQSFDSDSEENVIGVDKGKDAEEISINTGLSSSLNSNDEEEGNDHAERQHSFSENDEEDDSFLGSDDYEDNGDDNDF